MLQRMSHVDAFPVPLGYEMQMRTSELYYSACCNVESAASIAIQVECFRRDEISCRTLKRSPIPWTSMQSRTPLLDRPLSVHQSDDA